MVKAAFWSPCSDWLVTLQVLIGWPQEETLPMFEPEPGQLVLAQLPTEMQKTYDGVFSYI